MLEMRNANVASIGSVATLPKNDQSRPLTGRVRFTCWDSPKPFIDDDITLETTFFLNLVCCWIIIGLVGGV